MGRERCPDAGGGERTGARGREPTTSRRRRGGGGERGVATGSDERTERSGESRGTGIYAIQSYK